MNVINLSKKTSPSIATFLASLLCLILLLNSACSFVTSQKNEKILDVSLIIPRTNISQGHIFDLQLVLTNPGLYNVHVSRIVLPKEIMNSSHYIGSEPALTLVRNEIGDGLIEMDLTIAPAGQEKYLFRFEAIQSGTLNGSGIVRTDEQEYFFEVFLDIAGVNPVGWQPGTSPLITPTALNPLPWQAVVQIEAIVEVYDKETVGWAGSGTIISADGLILTNARLVLSDRFYQVRSLVVSLTVAEDAPPVPTYYASIVQADETLDLAVIKPYKDLDGNPLNYDLLNLPFVPLGDSYELNVGDSINILGYPEIKGETGTLTLTREEIRDIIPEENSGNHAIIQTSSMISGGYSGGSAVNAEGELIGVPTLVGSGDLNDVIADCNALVDTNRDGYIDYNDSCVPTAGLIDSLRPINLAKDLVNAARAGEVAIAAGNAIGGSFTPIGQVIIEDDFSDPKSGWNDIVTEEGERKYENGEYSLRIIKPKSLVWSDQEYLYDPIIIEADVRVVNSVGNADYGFVCGLVDKEHYYALEISEDGYYSIWKQDGEKTSILVDWSYSQEIAGGGTFRLSAQCGSEQLVLGLDGIILATVSDPSFQRGGVGMLAGTLDLTGFTVAFDNLQLIN
jgi:S1-C subfamily serine protease